jgi:uncharacterized membrane protein YgcG
MVKPGRFFRHLWCDEGDVRKALPEDAMTRLEERVQASERRHTGEIRICVEAGLPWDWLWRDATPRERAIEMFAELRVWDTEHNNGVLIYLLLAEHAIEIVDDRGLDRHVPDSEWKAVVGAMAEEFRGGRFEQGLTRAIDAVDALLTRHFPAAQGQENPNELPDRLHVR